MANDNFALGIGVVAGLGYLFTRMKDDKEEFREEEWYPRFYRERMALKKTRKQTKDAEMVYRKYKGRKGPALSATSVKRGTRRRGNDGNMWEVRKSGKSQRWFKGAESFEAETPCPVMVWREGVLTECGWWNEKNEPCVYHPDGEEINAESFEADENFEEKYEGLLGEDGYIDYDGIKRCIEEREEMKELLYDAIPYIGTPDMDTTTEHAKGLVERINQWGAESFEAEGPILTREAYDELDEKMLLMVSAWWNECDYRPHILQPLAQYLTPVQLQQFQNDINNEIWPEAEDEFAMKVMEYLDEYVIEDDEDDWDAESFEADACPRCGDTETYDVINTYCKCGKLRDEVNMAESFEAEEDENRIGMIWFDDVSSYPQEVTFIEDVSDLVWGDASDDREPHTIEETIERLREMVNVESEESFNAYNKTP